jgi:hypothetical protein
MNMIVIIAQVMIFVVTASLCDALASPKKESKLFSAGTESAGHVCRLVDNYRKTGQARSLESAIKVANAIIADKANVPSLTEISSILELSRYVPAVESNRYRDFAMKYAGAIKDSSSPAGEKFRFLVAQIERFDKETKEIQSKLPDEIKFPSDDFSNWAKIRNLPQSRKIIKRAERYINEEVATPPDDVYLQYWTTGNRTNYQNLHSKIKVRLVNLIIAESLERKNRFIPALVKTIDVICNQKSWVLPAHDKSGGGKGNFRQSVYSVDLVSSDTAAQLAHCIRFLGDALPKATVEKIKKEIELRIFAPLRLSYSLTNKSNFYHSGDPTGQWWISGGNNWNSVCHDNVISAALMLLDDPRDRAFFVARALKGLSYYAKLGFEEDGYCAEGMGYWNYGFGHLLMLGLTLRDVSNGKIDIFSDVRYRRAAEYAFNYQLEPGISPAFSDGTGIPMPKNFILVRRAWSDLVSRYALNVPRFINYTGNGWDNSSIRYINLVAFADMPKLPSSYKMENYSDRSEFPKGQVWLLRAGKELSVAVKGGYNNEHHNHNDIGSYYLVSNGKVLSGDPGGEVYTARTFSGKRYQSKVLSSYAHPVPVVDGKLQSTGARFRAKIFKTEFTDEKDIIVLDITRAYNVKHLVSLVRTFEFDRKNKEFRVTDCVKFSKPSKFQDVYTTFEGKKFAKPNVSIIVKKGGEIVESSEFIKNPNRVEPTRHVITFNNLVTEAELTLVFKSKITTP